MNGPRVGGGRSDMRVHIPGSYVSDYGQSPSARCTGGVRKHLWAYASVKDSVRSECVKAVYLAQ